MWQPSRGNDGGGEVTDDRKAKRNDQLIRRTVPGWALLVTTIVLVAFRENTSETLIGTLLGFSVLLLGVPLAGWISGPRRSEDKPEE